LTRKKRGVETALAKDHARTVRHTYEGKGEKGHPKPNGRKIRTRRGQGKTQKKSWTGLFAERDCSCEKREAGDKKAWTSKRGK